jgi:hypothetical protein
MSEKRRETWAITRSHGTHFSADEIAIIQAGYKSGLTPLEVSRELKCATRTINVWYAKLDEGWTPNDGRRRRRAKGDEKYVGPVKKRPVGKPNVMPGIDVSRLTGGR